MSHRRRLDRLAAVWPVPPPPPPGPGFDPARLTPEELAEFVPLCRGVRRRPGGGLDFTDATDAEVERQADLVAKGMAR